MITINGVVELQAAKASMFRLESAETYLTERDKEYMRQL